MTGTMTGVRTIALEEHFWTPELAAPPGTGPLAVWGQRVDDQLRDLGRARLADMDAHGIDVQVISHVAPAAQGLPGAEGPARAREANDRLAAAVRAHPERFAGFATLPTADPRAAADELDRAVHDLGLIGALVNSTLGSNGAFLDDARFAPLLDRFERLDVPLYLHPAPPSAALRDALYHGLPPAVAGRLATGAWGWHAEAGLHVLRLIATGVFDRHPALRLIVGHCGEMVPFMLDRIDVMLREHLGHHQRPVQPAAGAVHGAGARRGPGAVQRGLPVRRQCGGPCPAGRAAAGPGGQGEDRRRQRRADAAAEGASRRGLGRRGLGRRGPAGVIYVTLMLQKVCISRTIYGTMML